MPKVVFKQLDIKNVETVKIYDWLMEIYFEIGEQTYILSVESKEENGIFYPREVAHEGNGEACVYCDVCSGNTRCNTFSGRINRLFQHLLTFPSIRLEWLYIPHEIK